MMPERLAALRDMPPGEYTHKIYAGLRESLQEIERLQAELAAEMDRNLNNVLSHSEQVESLVQERDRLQAELSAVREDAERWRLLRSRCDERRIISATPSEFAVYIGLRGIRSPAELDAAIDAARRECP